MADAVRFNGQVVIRPEVLSRMLRDPNGAVMRRMIQDGELVKNEARRLVGVSKRDPVPRRKPKPPPGQLRASIVKRPVVVNGSPAVLVGSPLKYALWHHEGTQPHTILPRNGQYLVFFWPRTGRVMYLRSVNHPGTRPNRFLVNALRVLRGRYGR